ncbi:MAG: DUF4331 family protein [Candidatus Eremiobacteraeota bacterium]|nr:DUF4331 family protein [Candidatus Eremiobacteraeota bacterium]MBC5827375.1 DUF4331 family protein [Candidatus Eremiobacteraeota bacterium]
MRIFDLRILVLTAVVVGAAGCGGSGTTIGQRQTAYTQIERWGRPAVKEAFEAFGNHDTTNRSTPTNDPLLPSDIFNFMTTTAGRSPAIANVVKSVLIPDEMAADLSQPGPADYLGVETGGLASPTGSKFGGRALSDDVITISLSVIFGNTVPALGLAPDDGHESACLVTDNVPPGPAQIPQPTFPYLNGPY